MKKDFFGRKEEIKQLQEAAACKDSQLIAIYGRRRIGKTSLVESAFKQNYTLFKLEGLEDASTKEQLKSCYHDLNYFFGKSLKVKNDWHSFFDDLHQALSECKGKIIVFLDEFQWLANMRTALVSLFKKYWDNKFSKLTDCHFIICGSISSFIVKKVIKSKALYGRVNLEIQLRPLDLKEVTQFFPTNTPRNEILEVYMTLGGVPKYYEIYDYNLSLKQNYEINFFKRGSFFYSEIGKLFISHFGKNPHYQLIIQSLVDGRLTFDAIAKKTRLSSGGTLSHKLKDLVMAGFVREIKVLGARKMHYQINDPYLRFYFSFIQPNIDHINLGKFNFYRDSEKKLSSWYGLAFEHLCLNSTKIISDALSFSGVNYHVAPFQVVGKTKAGCQIDILFQRDDRTLTACELKYKQTLNIKEIIADFKQKETILAAHFPKYRISRVLISGHEFTENEKERALEYFHSALDYRDLFW